MKSYNNLKEPFNKHQINKYNILQQSTRFIPVNNNCAYLHISIVVIIIIVNSAKAKI